MLELEDVAIYNIIHSQGIPKMSESKTGYRGQKLGQKIRPRLKYVCSVCAGRSKN